MQKDPELQPAVMTENFPNELVPATDYGIIQIQYSIQNKRLG